MPAPELPGAPFQVASRSTTTVSLAVFMDRSHLRDQVCEDAAAAGYRVVESAPLERFAEQARIATAAVFLIDCPAPAAATLAVLARQDVAARDRRTQLIVSTSLDSLEDVFGCLDQSQPQLLVDPTSTDFALALGHALAASGRGSLRELASDDRRVLVRLAEQVSQIAARLERLEQERSHGGERLRAPALAFRSAEEPLVRQGAGIDEAVGPDPRLLRQILRYRQQRAAFLGPDLFADPAWDMLLDLTAARGEGKRVSITSLCIAAGVPATTALRWIGHMTEAGLFERFNDQADRRRTFIGLTDKAAGGMAAFFATLGGEAGLVV